MEAVRLGESFASVIAAARAGADWAVATLYRHHQPALLRYLSARAGAEGEDLASATWLDVARSLGRFEGDEEHFRRWVYTIANRRLTDWLRQRSRRSDDRLPVATPKADPADEVVGALAGDEAARRIAAVLTPDQAEVVLLRVVAGFPVDEVAELTGRSPGAVRVMSHRALRKLAKEFRAPR